jgi:opacity protein-like surface antigen
MFNKRFLATACVAAALCGVPAFAGGNVNFSLGNRSLDDNATAPVDEQMFVGGYMDFEIKDWPVALAGGLYRSSKSDSTQGLDVEATITEISFGAVKNWTVLGNMHPFAGGGLSMVKVEAEVSDAFFSEKADDTNLSAYAEGGVFWTLANVMNLGVQGRFTRGSSADLGGASFDPDYFQLGVIAGFGWGRN